MVAFLQDFLAHSEWANSIFFRAWDSSPGRDHQELRGRVEHILGVQQGFLRQLQGEPTGSPPDGPPPTFDELKTWAKTSHAEFQQYAQSLKPDALSAIVHIPWFPDPPCIITTAEALVQVAMHSQHHRGQCMTRLKDFGGTPQNVDWIIWLWKQKPVAKWD